MKHIKTYTSVNRRENNQDSCLGFEINLDVGGGIENIAVLILSDGMGGHEHGEIASRLVVDTMAQLISKRLYGLSIKPLHGKKRLHQSIDFQKTIFQSMVQTNQKMLMLIKNNKWKKAGATVTAAIVTKDRYHWGSIGDSHIYHWRNNAATLSKISYDHSFVGILLQEGTIEPEAARFHSEKNRIVYYMGIENLPPREKIKCTGSGNIKHGDILMLCSDGISGKPQPEELESIFRSQNHDNGPYSFDPLAEHLMDCGLRLNETDNQTLVLYGRGQLLETNSQPVTVPPEINDTRRLREQSEKEKKQLERQLNQLSTSLKQAETDKTGIRRDLAKKSRTIDKMDSDKQKLQSQIDGLNEKINDSTTSVATLNQELGKKEDHIKFLQNRIQKQLEPKIEDAKTTQAERDQLKQALESKSREVREVEDDIKIQRQQIDEKNKDLDNATSKIAALKKQMDELNLDSEKAERDLASLKSKLEQKSQTITLREREIDGLNDELDLKDEEIKGLKKASTELGRKLRQQKGEMKDRTTRLYNEKSALLRKIKQWKITSASLAAAFLIMAILLTFSATGVKQSDLTAHAPGDLPPRGSFPEPKILTPPTNPLFSYPLETESPETPASKTPPKPIPAHTSAKEQKELSDRETKIRLYSIKKNDTLSDIAELFDTSLKAIKDLNPGIKDRSLQIGQKIKIPAAKSTPPKKKE